MELKKECVIKNSRKQLIWDGRYFTWGYNGGLPAPYVCLCPSIFTVNDICYTCTAKVEKKVPQQ